MIGFFGILKLGCLLDLVDLVILVNLFEVDQWNLLLIVDIHKEDFSTITVISNHKREVDLIIAMD